MHQHIVCKQLEHKTFKVNYLHPTAVLIKPNCITPHTLTELNELAVYFRNLLINETLFFTQAVPAFDSLLLEWEQQSQSNTAIHLITKKASNYFNQQRTNTKTPTKPFLVPACYCNKCALDKEHLATQLNLSFDEITHIHSNQTYHVQAIGFIPGFAYLGDVDKRIRLPRHKTPRVHVDKNSIAIGENKTAIYPSDSPGGWNLIAKTPIASLEKNIFNKKEPHPLLTIGQKIQFYPINHHEYSLLLKENNHA